MINCVGRLGSAAGCLDPESGTRAGRHSTHDGLDKDSRARRSIASGPLRTMEDLAQATIDAVSAHICVLDQTGRILTVNKAWRDFHQANRPPPGSTCDDIGRDYLAVCDRATGPSSDGAAPMAEGIRRVMRRELDAYSAEYPCHGPDEERWFRAVVTRFQGDSGHVVVAHENISERRRAEQALRDSEARLRRSLMLLPEAVLISGSEGIGFVNEAAQRLFGAAAPDLLGRSPLHLVHPDSIEVARATWAAPAAGASPPSLSELKILRPDGAVRIVESTAAVIDDRGQASVLAVLRDVTEVRRLRTELARSHDDLQRLVAAQDSMQENERRRIARELHDDLQQSLSAIKMDLAEIRQRVAVDPPSVAPLLAAIDELTTATIVSTRRIVNDLRPQILDGLGLQPALDRLVHQFGRRSGLRCALDMSDPGLRSMPQPTSDVSTCLYRVAQEALNNVAKHAQAASVSVRLAAPPGGRLVLRVVDDGAGIRPEDLRKPGSFGLLGMQERLRVLGGTLSVAARAQGPGTVVEASVPTPARVLDGARPEH